jgi:hypothetical protein
VVVPLAEIFPDFENPLAQESLEKTATRLRQKVWLETRPDLLSQFHSKP